MRLIDADVLCDSIDDLATSYSDYDKSDFATSLLRRGQLDVISAIKSLVKNTPTADINEPAHWEKIQPRVLRCSRCKGLQLFDFSYCPLCGRKMDNGRP